MKLDTKVDIIPFNQFWTFCTLSDMLSILISKEPSYYAAAVINSYYYTVRGTDAWWRDLQINWNKDFLKSIYDLFSITKVRIERHNVIQRLKMLINDNEKVHVNVDVYGIKNRVDYQLKHVEHHILMTGYNDDKKIFYFLLDTMSGYGENEISFDGLMNAMVFTDDFAYVDLYRTKDPLPIYRINFQEVFEYADIQLKCLSKLSYMQIYSSSLYSREDTSYVFIILTKVVERQKANKCFFQHLIVIDYLSQNVGKDLIRISSELEHLWKEVRSIFMKSFYRNKEPDYDRVNFLVHQCILTEHNLWSAFISSIMVSDKPRSYPLANYTERNS